MSAPFQDIDTPEALLEAVYRDLEFTSGDLVDASPTPAHVADNEWVNKGEWLTLAATVGVEKVFFVDNNPVIVFARETNVEPEHIRRVFNRIWCMARPHLLFLACPGELSVFNLTKPPARDLADWSDDTRAIDVVRKAAEVQSSLLSYKRDQVETGRLFEDNRFGEVKYRADETLIQDLRTVRDSLIANGLPVEYAHSLIGRSIFVRYLEDRKILQPEYFSAIAESNLQWKAYLDDTSFEDDGQVSNVHSNFVRFLSNKELAYALFDKLSIEFNGDMFPSDTTEKSVVSEAHLRLLQGFLRGDVGPQRRLFFFAYKFDIIPIELISSIYEEFYNTQEGKTANQGSHYTPSVLVEFLLSQVLTPELLAEAPRVLDPACGSGIFLVETFKRIVRYQIASSRSEGIDRSQLLSILREQIIGIDINPAAIRVAAFSLYLAFLHYQDPPDIRQHPRLPNLIYDSVQTKQSERFDILVAANSFDVEATVFDVDVRNCLSSGTADVVVGNPPWGSPKSTDKIGLAAAKTAIKWCKKQKKAVGDKELSQAFIHRTIDFLKAGGHAALLVSTGVFFKEQNNSKQFRREWLSHCMIQQAVNFAHVRDIFFRGPGRSTNAIAPFASVIFTKVEPTRNHLVQYWSAKKTPISQKMRAAVLSKSDLRTVLQVDLFRHDELWKVYWWGSHWDAALVRSLELEQSLGDIPNLAIKGKNPKDMGFGFEEASKSKQRPSGDLLKYKELPALSFDRYGPIYEQSLVPVPASVYRLGNLDIYDGTRLLVKRGIAQQRNFNGRIIARLETQPFCFRHSIHGIRLQTLSETQAKVLLGIVWSSLARYYFFMTIGSWGMWHHAVDKEALKKLPVRFSDDNGTADRIVACVDALREGRFATGLFSDPNFPAIEELEAALDEAIFDLFALSPPERDLIRDMCEVGLEFLYRGAASNAVKPLELDDNYPKLGTADDLPASSRERIGIWAYLFAFLESWNTRLSPDAELSWQVIMPIRASSMVAVRFSTKFMHGPDAIPQNGMAAGWLQLLSEIEASSVQPFVSRNIYIDGLLRITTDTDIIIVKRNERRLWTASMAREDAEATMLQIVQMQQRSGRSPE